MAELLEFPTHPSEVDHLPEPADPYRAHARPNAAPAVSLAFCRADGRITSFPTSMLRQADFAPAGSTHSLDLLTFQFSEPILKQSVTVRVEGRNLLGLFSLLSEDAIRWLRELPEGWPLDDPTMPVITRITLPTLPL